MIDVENFNWIDFLWYSEQTEIVSVEIGVSFAKFMLTDE